MRLANRTKYEIEIPDPEGSGDGTHASKEQDDDESITDNISEAPRGPGRRPGGRPAKNDQLKKERTKLTVVNSMM